MGEKHYKLIMNIALILFMYLCRILEAGNIYPSNTTSYQVIISKSVLNMFLLIFL